MEGDRPPLRAARRAGLHKRMTGRDDSGYEEARKTGDTARVGAGVLPTLYPGAREGRSPLAFLRKEETCWSVQAMPRRKRQPQERQHSADAERGGTRDRLQSRDRLTRHPNAGQ